MLKRGSWALVPHECAKVNLRRRGTLNHTRSFVLTPRADLRTLYHCTNLSLNTGTQNCRASYKTAERMGESGNLVEFAAARGFLFIAPVLYSAVL